MINPLRFLIVEDEALLALELSMLVEDCGHQVVGTAYGFDQAVQLLHDTDIDVALVDVHLADGPTGIDVMRYITQHSPAVAIFITANARRLPDDFAGAAGVIPKPFTRNGLMTALHYIEEGVRTPPPRVLQPASLRLSPGYTVRWGG